MTLVLEALLVVSLIELGLYLPFVKRARKFIAGGLLIVLAVTTGALVATHLSGWSVLVAVASFYRIINMLRLVEGRLQPQRLLRSTLRTSVVLMGMQLLLLTLWWLSARLRFGANSWWLGVVGAQLIVAIGLLLITKRHLRRIKPSPLTKHYTDQELPSITVCIPARNETETLEECLQALVASDYPKLEILVLDDCSQDRTSEIIRSFAHAGVRFVKGTEIPTSSWLAKNWAYEQLYTAASGELLVFCGVDVRFEPSSLRVLVGTLLERQKHMLTIVPHNIAAGVVSRHSVLLQPMRYAWELSLPRRLVGRPASLSTCWAAERAFLKHNGSFAAISASIVPESYFARAATKDDGYSFLSSNNELAVTSQKSWHDQWETAVRTRYPQLRRKPELVFALSVVELVCLVAPCIEVIVWCLQHHWLLVAISTVAVLMLIVTYVQLVQLTYRQLLWRSLVALPFAVLLDVYTRNYSMWQYEFSEVYWKGRNICLPVLRVIPNLPKL